MKTGKAEEGDEIETGGTEAQGHHIQAWGQIQIQSGKIQEGDRDREGGGRRTNQQGERATETGWAWEGSRSTHKPTHNTHTLTYCTYMIGGIQHSGIHVYGFVSSQSTMHVPNCGLPALSHTLP